MCGFFLKSNVNVGSEICTALDLCQCSRGREILATAQAHEFVCSESITWHIPVSITSGKEGHTCFESLAWAYELLVFSWITTVACFPPQDFNLMYLEQIRLHGLHLEWLLKPIYMWLPTFVRPRLPFALHPPAWALQARPVQHGWGSCCQRWVVDPLVLIGLECCPGQRKVLNHRTIYRNCAVSWFGSAVGWLEHSTTCVRQACNLAHLFHCFNSSDCGWNTPSRFPPPAQKYQHRSICLMFWPNALLNQCISLLRTNTCKTCLENT